jgi:hypothetical protein
MSSFTDARNNAADLVQASQGAPRSRKSGARSRREFVRIAVVAAGTAILASQALGLGVAGASPMPALTTPSTTTLANPGPAATTHDTVTITGVAPTQSLVGTVNVQYVLGNGAFQSIPASVTYVDATYDSPFSLNTTGADVTLTINYPPAYLWPEQVLIGTQQIYVNLAIEVWENGALIGTLGPGQDWSVSVINNPILILPASKSYNVPHCPITTTHALITTTGVSAAQQISGTVWAQYVLDNGAVQQIPGSLQFGGTTHNSPLTLTVQKGVNMEVHLNLPSSAQWLAQASGKKEIQVLMSLNVLDNGNNIGTHGTGQQYTVFCLGTPPAPKKTSGKKH